MDRNTVTPYTQSFCDWPHETKVFRLGHSKKLELTVKNGCQHKAPTASVSNVKQIQLAAFKLRVTYSQHLHTCYYYYYYYDLSTLHCKLHQTLTGSAMNSWRHSPVLTNSLTFAEALILIKPPEVYRQSYVYSSVNIKVLLAAQFPSLFLISPTFPWPLSKSPTFPGFPGGHPHG